MLLKSSGKLRAFATSDNESTLRKSEGPRISTSRCLRVTVTWPSGYPLQSSTHHKMACLGYFADDCVGNTDDIPSAGVCLGRWCK